MTSNIRTNIAVCEALGIDAKGVVGIDIKMRPGDFPRVQITRFLMDNPSAKTSQQFELRAIGPSEPYQIDLEAMAADATDRVIRHIAKSADEARAAISKAFKRANRRLLKTWSIERLEDTDVELHLSGLRHPVYVEGGAA